ncbi:MAG: hypothetical protein HQL47_11870 [Gammaproteobacteria bacterium]|nr:hypothetical protein [Gammaproteobacteria bacterium]
MSELNQNQLKALQWIQQGQWDLIGQSQLQQLQALGLIEPLSPRYVPLPQCPQGYQLTEAGRCLLMRSGGL